MIKGYALIELVKYKYQNINVIEIKRYRRRTWKVNKNEIYAFVGSLPNYNLCKQR